MWRSCFWASGSRSAGSRLLSSLEERLSGDGRDGFDDCAVFAGAIGELYVAFNGGAAEAETGHVLYRDLFYAGGSDGHTQTCANEAHDCQPLRGFLHDARAKSVFLAEGDWLFIGESARGWREEDEGLIAKVFCGDGLVLGERMSLRKDSDEGFGEEGLDFEAGCLATIAQEACVELAFLKFFYDGGGVGLVKLQVYLWVEPAIAPQHARQGSEHCGSDETDSQEALFAATDAARLVDVFLDVAESSPCAFQKDFAGAGKFYGTRCPEEEGITENLFELADLLREWGLGEVKAECCASEVQLLGDCDEVAQVAKLDVSIHI